MSVKTVFSGLLTATAIALPVHAEDFTKLDEALPGNIDITSIAPVFDFDTDGCLPAAGISRNGDMNGGQKPVGSLTGACTSANFLESSNTLHRHACIESDGASYCGHFYSLYFEKDQILAGIESGHRHDWEFAAVWTVNGEVTHGSYSAHGDLSTAAASDLDFEGGHLKLVYHKDSVLTHALRFAKSGETAENPYGAFVTPTIVSWYAFTGGGLNNMVMRTLLDNFDYGSANLPVRSDRFLNDLNEFKPANYPTFTAASVLASNPGQQEAFVQIVNDNSGLCLDVNNGNMSNGTNVMQWTCNGANWQKWYRDTSTGMIHNKQDPRFCLDNGSVFGNGANIVIWWCWGGDSQRFVELADGFIGLEVDPNQVLDGYGSNAGDNVGTWYNWGNLNQRWTLVP